MMSIAAASITRVFLSGLRSPGAASAVMVSPRMAMSSFAEWESEWTVPPVMRVS